jgi:hypothetical protein
MTGETPTATAEAVIEDQVREAAGQQAMGEPLPGPVRDAFTPMQSVRCGPYTVRFCCDGDIEYLSLLDHPLNEMRLRKIANPDPNAPVESLYEPTGKMAWDLCYLFTHTLDEVDELYENGGIPAFRKASKKEFSRLTYTMLAALSTACIQQYGRYWNPVLSYGAAESQDEEGVVKKK